MSNHQTLRAAIRDDRLNRGHLKVLAAVVGAIEAGNCAPRVSWLAAQSGLSVPAVRNATSRLRTTGYLTSARAADAGRVISYALTGASSPAIIIAGDDASSPTMMQSTVPPSGTALCPTNRIRSGSDRFMVGDLLTGQHQLPASISRAIQGGKASTAAEAFLEIVSDCLASKALTWDHISASISNAIVNSAKDREPTPGQLLNLATRYLTHLKANGPLPSRAAVSPAADAWNRAPQVDPYRLKTADELYDIELANGELGPNPPPRPTGY